MPNPRYYFVTIDGRDVSATVDWPIQWGKYLIVDTGGSGLVQEAEVIATADDQVHARGVVDAMEAKHLPGRTELVVFEHTAAGIVARCLLCRQQADPVAHPSWHGEHIRTRHPEYVTWEPVVIPEFDERTETPA